MLVLPPHCSQKSTIGAIKVTPVWVIFKLVLQIGLSFGLAVAPGKVLNVTLETEATIWVLSFVKPHAPRPGTKLNRVPVCNCAYATDADSSTFSTWERISRWGEMVAGTDVERRCVARGNAATAAPHASLNAWTTTSGLLKTIWTATVLVELLHHTNVLK